MKKGVILGIVLAVVIILALGFYFYKMNSNYSTPSPTANIPSNINNTPLNSSELPPLPPVTSASNIIEISGYSFLPVSLTISPGDSVTWTNKDSAAHIIVSDLGNELSSGRLSQGSTYSHTFSTKGTFAYHCSIHSSMKGTIIVE